MKKHTSKPGLQKAPLLTLLLFFAMQVLSAQPFVTTWEVVAPNTLFDIPGKGTNYQIDWEEVGNPANHGTVIGNGTTRVEFPSGGTYKLSFSPGSGSFTGFCMRDAFGYFQERLLSIEQWGSIAWSSMSGAFYSCGNMSYNATDVPDLSNVTDMSDMFYWCNKFNGDLSGWNTSNVTDMSWMFYNAHRFNGNIGTWNTANVTNMSYMFYHARDFNQDIGGWNTANVTNMEAMFYTADDFNQDIGNWNTAQVTSMRWMFNWAQRFNQNLGNWQLNSVVDISVMLEASGMRTDNYDQTLIGWNDNPATPDGLSLKAWPARYCQAEAARNNLINVKGWTISDDGPTPCCVPPSFSACPNNPITVNTSSNQCNAVVTYTIPIAGYPAPSLNYTFTGATSGSGSGTGSGSTFNKGNTTVTITASNNCGTPTCVFTVTVNDAVPPAITCPGNATITANASCSGALGAYAPVSVSDNCTANPTVTQSPASGTALNGHNNSKTVTLTADDGNGNTQACSFTVTLKDQTKPSITCPANATVTANASCSGTVGSFAAASVSDNCTANPTVTQSPAASTVLTGHNDSKTVTLTADDGNGNTQACTFTVTLKDQTKPSISCPANANVTANASCSGTIGSFAAASVSDNCTANPTVSQSPASSTVLTGHNDSKTVTLTADDGNGNTQACTFTVTLKDQTKPSITCPANAIVAANASCSGTVGSFAAASVSDNCTANPTVTQSPASSTVLNGHNDSKTVTLTADDGNGNTQACSFTVTLKDQTNPTITCPANLTVTPPEGQCTAAVTYTIPLGADNCSQVNISHVSGGLSGDTFPAGATTVIWQATDPANNNTTCSFTVTVNANTVPVITCPANIVQANTPDVCGSIVTFTAPTAPIVCGQPAPVTQTGGLPSGSTFPVGLSTVTYTATAPGGATGTCAFTVTINDTQPPTVTCPANAIIAANASCSGTLGAYAAVSVSDNCTANPTVTQSPASGTALNGHNDSKTVTLTADDGNGNTQACTFTVTLKDQTKPSISCPANATITANASCSGTLGAYTPSSVSDNCTASPTVTQSPAASTLLSGHNDSKTVTLTADDGNGNTQACSFTVTLKDLTKPNITCPANATVAANASCSGTVGSFAPASVSDNCAANPTVTQSPASSTALNGHNDSKTVTLTADDGNGNTQACSFTVTLKDQTGPSLTCKPATVNLNAAGTGSITTASVYQSGSDNCGSVNLVSVTPSTFNCSNVGANTVTLTANDGNGNNGTCTATVTVVDPIAPTLLCKNVTLSLNASGQATLSVSQVNNGSYDNCSIVAFGLSQSVFTCANIGNNNVTLSGRDKSNNNGQCTAVVTVTDPIVPVAKCKDLTANLGANGTVLVDPNWANNGSSDNCSFTLSITPNLFNCSNLGQNTVTLKATDAGGNTATCTAKVTVRDVTGPTAKCKNPTIYLDDSGNATLSATQVDNGSSDNCGMGSMSVNKTAFDCSHISGTQSVTLSMTDVNGNSASCTSTVTVKDAMAPTAICEDVTVELGPNGTVVVYGAELASYSYDNCSVYSYSPIAKVYTAANMGANNLTITVKDWSVNAGTCVSVVTVVPAGNGNLQQPGGNGKSGNHGFGEFSVYPNPSSGEATMAFQLPAEQAFSLRIFDLAGRMVYSQEDLGVEGENTMPLHLNGLLPGVYMIDFQSDNWKTQKRLVLQR